MKILKYIPPIYQIIIWPLCRCLLNFFCYLRVSGIENLKEAVEYLQGKKEISPAEIKIEDFLEKQNLYLIF